MFKKMYLLVRFAVKELAVVIARGSSIKVNTNHTKNMVASRGQTEQSNEFINYPTGFFSNGLIVSDDGKYSHLEKLYEKLKLN